MDLISFNSGGEKEKIEKKKGKKRGKEREKEKEKEKRKGVVVMNRKDYGCRYMYVYVY